MTTFPEHRTPTHYGDVRLSVQAAAFAYCEPRVNGLPLDEYGSVEIAILRTDGAFVLPSELGIEGFDHLWEGDQVAGYVSQSDVARLRAALEEYAAKQ